MKVDWKTALSRPCGYCTAEPRRGCVVMNGNSTQIVARTHDGHAAAAHRLRSLVWEDTDMARECATCAAAVGQPCRSVIRGDATYGPHVARMAASRLAESPGGVYHVRNPENGGRSLCGVRVMVHDPEGSQIIVGGAVTTIRDATCRTCRITARHLAARRDGCHDAVVRSAGQHATT